MREWEKGGGIPLDRSRPFDPRDYPHRPEKYHMHIHFLQRMKEPERFLDGEVIARTITSGRVKDNGDGCAAFHWSRHGGVEYWLVAGFHEDGHRIVVTMWPYLRDRQAALDSGRWTPEQLDTIEAFNQKSRNRSTRFSEEWDEYIEWSKSHRNGAKTY